jgi:L-alanine-DL-glutamate epimerase-like enolase superfamily enzyme
MQRQVRTIDRDGFAATAISAIDTALWDLKAKLLDLPLAKLLGMVRDRVTIYGGGGHCQPNVRRSKLPQRSSIRAPAPTNISGV